MPSEVWNDYLKESLVVTPHAAARWAERGYGELGDSVKAALPFGGQRGKDFLLRDTVLDLAFVVGLDRKEKTKLIKTCLTLDQAFANMAMHNHRVKDQVKTKPAVAPSPVVVNVTPSTGQSVVINIPGLNGPGKRVPSHAKIHDSEIMKIVTVNITSLTDDSLEAWIDKAALAGSNVGRIATVLLAKEKELRRIRKHADHMDLCRRCLRAAIREKLGNEDNVLEILKLSNRFLEENAGTGNSDPLKRISVDAK